MALSGHYWTVWSLWRNRRRAGVPPAWSPWRASVEDPWLGQVPLTGKLAAAARGEREAAAHGGALIVLVHGLGGCSDSLYLLRAARVCHRLGLSSLRLDLRGSDREGHDIYHAGLSSDLAVALASEDLRPFGEIYLLGFSVGGHVVLRFATEVDDPRVKAVSAVCSPLDLAATVDHFDQPHRLVYRRYILQGLRDLYRSVDARARSQGRRLPVKLEEVLAVRGLRQWDALTVVPRFGFGDTDTYYREASAGPRLHRLRVPALLVAAEGDPMVTSASVRAGLGSWGGRRLRDAGLDVRWVEKGGHVGFPDDLDLGSEAPPGLEHQVLAWLLGHG